MEIKESISIAQSPEKIWNFWLPVTTDVQWRSGVIKAEWTSQPPHGIGSTGVNYIKDIGEIPWEIIRWEKSRYFEFIHKDGRLKGSIASYHVEPETGGSRASIHAKMTGPFIMRIILVFMKSMMTKGIKGNLQRLKEIMEKQPS